MAYQVEDQNGNQPDSPGLWGEAIEAYEKDRTSFEWNGNEIEIKEVCNTGNHTKITINHKDISC